MVCLDAYTEDGVVSLGDQTLDTIEMLCNISNNSVSIDVT